MSLLLLLKQAAIGTGQAFAYGAGTAFVLVVHKVPVSDTNRLVMVTMN